MALNKKRVLKISSRIFIGLFILFVVIAYLRYLDLKKAFIAKVSEEATSLIGQGVQIEDLSFGPFLSINLYGITVRNPEGFPPGQLLRIKRIRLEIRLKELLRRNISFKSIDLFSPELTLVSDGKGKWNVSDYLLRYSSEKSTGKRQIDELRIDSGSFDLNKDPRFRSEQIDLRLENLSSEPGARTGIKGAINYAGNKIRLEGWTYLNDVPMRANLSVSSKDVALSPFRKALEAYKIDTEKIRLSFDFRAEGDLASGFHITSDVLIKGFRSLPFMREQREIRLHGDGMFSLRDYSLIITTASLLMNGAPAATFRGKVAGLNKNPFYIVDMSIDRLDLSGFHFMKNVKLSGILSSKGIHVAGDLGSKTPEVSGGVGLREGAIESPDAIVQKIDADILFSSGKEMAVKTETSATLVRAGAYALAKPVNMKASTTLRATQQRIDVSSSLSLSPLEIQLKDATTISFENSNVTVEGSFKGNDFSGRSSFEIKGVRFAGYTTAGLKGSSIIDYQPDAVTLTSLTLEAEEGTSSANRVNITLPRERTGYAIDVKGMNVRYRQGDPLLKQCDLQLYLHPNSNSLSGDLRFLAGNILFQGIASRNISGDGRFDEKGFSIDIHQAEMFGGRVKLAAAGSTSKTLFPIKATVVAEGIDLAALMKSMPKSITIPYHVAGELKKATFDGIMNSYASLHGSASLETGTLSFSDSNTGRNIIKDTSLKAVIDFKGKDLTLEADAVAGKVLTHLSGTIKGFSEKERSVQIEGILPEVRLTEIRNSFWDLFPDSLLYAGLDGSISSDVSILTGKDGPNVSGTVTLKDCFLKGEYGEYSIGPINGQMPVAYRKGTDEGEAVSIPSFEKSRFSDLTTFYAKETMDKDLHRITIGSLDYGFPLLKDLTLLVKQSGGLLKIERFGANIFGGKLDGSAFVDLSKGLNYRAGFLIKGLSMATLCEGIEPIKGFISGKVDGIATFKGTGTGLSHLIGMADFWTYAAPNEKTLISKEFLQKIGGPSVRSYLGNRNFDNGVLSLYLQNGDLIFKQLEISNRNFFGIKDLDVKVAPFNNRIAVDKFLWAITEAAQRAKEKK